LANLQDEGHHAVFVDGWLKRSAKDLQPEVLLALFEAALGALWAATKTTLGEVTLTAIAERVVFNTAEKFPRFSVLEVEPANGIQVRELRQQIGSVGSSQLREGFRFVLVEFLTVLGNLTAEVLTPELHAELEGVVPPQAARLKKGMQGIPIGPKDSERGGKKP
jgi:hypothetical protein